MQIKIFIDENNDPKYSIGEDSGVLFELVMGLGFAKPTQIKEKLGATMPELVIDMELDESNKDHQELIEVVAGLRELLAKVYK